MTASELYRRAFEPERFRILGRDLLPLTLGHYGMLDAMECSKIDTASAVGLACLICSMPHTEVAAYMASPLLPLRLWIWSKRVGPWDAEEKAHAFADYVRYHTELPKTVRLQAVESGPENPIPIHQQLRVSLVSSLGYSPETVDETPFLKALWDITTLRVMQGRCVMLDKTDEDLEREASEIDVEALRKAAEACLAKN